MTDTNPIELVQKISAQIDGIKAENQKINEALKVTADGATTDAKAAIKAADESAKKVAEMAANILEIEQKLGERVISGKADAKTLGQIIIASEAYKSFASGGSRFKIEANTITGQSGSPAENSDILVPADRQAGIVPLAFRALNVFDVIPQGTTTSNAVEVTREATNTNNAAEKSEGAAKAESAITYSLITTPIRTIPTFLKVSKQVIEDSAQLASHIDTRLRHMVNVRYQNQIVAGNGTNPNISGILDTGNFTAFTATSGENQLDSLNRMIEAVYVADFQPTGIMMNPADFFAIDRIKKGTGDVSYVIGDPASGMINRIWGLPVVVSSSVTSGTAIVGDFERAYMIWNRQGATVEMFEQDDTNVQSNLITIRAELRGALATYVPTACYAGALTV